MTIYVETLNISLWKMISKWSFLPPGTPGKRVCSLEIMVEWHYVTWMYLCSASPAGTLVRLLLFKWSSLRWGVLAREPLSTAVMLLKPRPNLQQKRGNKLIHHTWIPSYRHVINQVNGKGRLSFLHFLFPLPSVLVQTCWTCTKPICS